MANIQQIDTSYFDGFTNELNGKLMRLRHLIKNYQADGNYHEEILRVVLRNFLTKRYSVKTGFIYKDVKNISNQMDIIIVDENSPAAYIFQEGEFAIVMPEAVMAYVEVKTTLSVGEHDKALKNIASAKKLMENQYSTAGIIFGFRSDAHSKSTINNHIIDGWLKRKVAKDIADSNKAYGPDAVIWLNDNYSLIRYDPTNNNINDGYDYHSFTSHDGNTGWQLSVLLAIIVGACERAQFNSTHHFGNNLAGRLLGMKVMEVSDEAYGLGVGVIKKTKS